MIGGEAAPDPVPGYRFRVAEMPEDDRPRERLKRLGGGALKSEELLAILLRTGTAQEDVLHVAARLLHERGGLRGLAATDLATLGRAHGVGPAKASTIAAAFELGRRAAVEEGGRAAHGDQPAGHRATAAPGDGTAPAGGAAPAHPGHQAPRPFRARALPRHRKFRGGRVAELFREAVRLNASKIALAHNHPSGDPAPSADDITFTREAVEAGDLLEIPVLDHLVFGHGPGRWISMRERRLGFS